MTGSFPVIPPDEQPTQSQYPARASARTAAATALPAVAFLYPYLSRTLGDERALIVCCVLVVLNALVTRLMVSPTVESALRSLLPLLAAAPKQQSGAHRKDETR